MIFCFLTSASLLTSLCARVMGRGMSSLVSFVANPKTMPWSPAPCSWPSFSVTPREMSGDCSVIETSTPQVSQSKPSLALSKPISFMVLRTMFGMFT